MANFGKGKSKTIGKVIQRNANNIHYQSKIMEK